MQKSCHSLLIQWKQTTLIHSRDLHLKLLKDCFKYENNPDSTFFIFPLKHLSFLVYLFLSMLTTNYSAPGWHSELESQVIKLESSAWPLWLVCIVQFYLWFHLQGLKYAQWAKGLRVLWTKRHSRLYAFWFTAVSMITVVVTGITTDFVKWDKLNHEFMASDELSRAFLTSFILVVDLLIVMQVSGIYQAIGF